MGHLTSLKTLDLDDLGSEEAESEAVHAEVGSDTTNLLTVMFRRMLGPAIAVSISDEINPSAKFISVVSYKGVRVSFDAASVEVINAALGGTAHRSASSESAVTPMAVSFAADVLSEIAAALHKADDAHDTDTALVSVSTGVRCECLGKQGLLCVERQVEALSSALTVSEHAFSRWFLGNIPVELRLTTVHFKNSLAQLRDLHAGKIIKSSVMIEEPLSIKVEGNTIALAKPCLQNTRRAGRIVSQSEERLTQ